jgi:regulation of enolase protein 1 (concanavalin A-like superfamily)
MFPARCFLETPAMRIILYFLLGFGSVSLRTYAGSDPAEATKPLVLMESFHARLAPEWSWEREHPETWRLTSAGLEIRIEPGNMWGSQNNARNVLIHPAPDPAVAPVEVSVLVENRPINQYEQVDLVWYYDDSNMVKIGEELVDGTLTIVMGREEQDRTRTIIIIPIDFTQVQLRLIVTGNQIQGFFRHTNEDAWRKAGECDLPAQAAKPGQISLQCYQGKEGVEHWARITDFVLKPIPPDKNRP